MATLQDDFNQPQFSEQYDSGFVDYNQSAPPLPPKNNEAEFADFSSQQSAPALPPKNTYDSGFTDFNQEVDFSSQQAPPLPEKNKTKEPAVEEEEEGIETTLDEPVFTTLWREIKKIGIKMFHVVAFCKGGQRVIEDWDLWGPMIVCYVLALLLSLTSTSGGAAGDEDYSSYIFSIVFVCFWIGAIIVSLNTKFLGGNLTIPQSVCIVGYCVFPIFGGACITTICTAIQQNLAVWVGVPLMIACDIWSCVASFAFLRNAIELKKRPLADYPIILFFSLFTWLTLVVNISGWKLKNSA